MKEHPASGPHVRKLEGFVHVSGFRIFYRSIERIQGGEVVLCVHGGPGATHDYLIPLADLTHWGYRVIFYDMWGCGRSQSVDAGSAFTIDTSVEDLEGVRRALKLNKIHLFGHSLGGAVAVAYALKYSQNLIRLIVSSGFASVPLVESAIQKLKSELLPMHRSAIRTFEEAGDYRNPKYRKAVRELIRRHYSRGLEEDEAPEHAYTLAHVNKDLYRAGWGPNDFVVTGSMKGWDITKSLHTIHIPCLITVGRYDEIPLAVAESMHEEIHGSQLVVFENSSHLAMWEERERFIKTLTDFLSSPPKRS